MTDRANGAPASETERPFYRHIKPTEFRRDPPLKWLPAEQRESWRELGIDLASILLRDPEKMNIKVLLHALYNGEIGGAAGFGRRYVLATEEGIDNLPWELGLVNARLSWDECRHTEIALHTMAKYGVHLGELADGYLPPIEEEQPETDEPTVDPSGVRGNPMDLAEGMAAVHRGGEGLAMNLFTSLIDMGRNLDDPDWERAFDYNHADEVMHVDVGNYWVPRLTKGDPEKQMACAKAQQAFEELVMALNTGEAVEVPEEFAV